jgi:hypothetical protein
VLLVFRFLFSVPNIELQKLLLPSLFLNKVALIVEKLVDAYKSLFIIILN